MDLPRLYSRISNLIFLIVMTFSVLDFAAVEANASNGIRFGVRRLLFSRCRHYGGAYTQASQNCRIHAQALASTIDVVSARDPLTNQNSGAFYGRRLIEIMKSRNARLFIDRVAKAIEARESGINVWDLSLQYNENHFEKAWEWMALLFQDTSEARVHIGFLRGSLPQEFRSSIEQLEAIHRFISQSNPSPGTPGHLQLFPKELLGVESNSLHHFYMIGYFSLRTRDRMNESPLPPQDRFAKVNPFIINTVYEYFRNGLTPGLSWIPRNPREVNLRELLETFEQWLFPTDPASIDANRFRDALTDIYLGYAATEFALSAGQIPLNFSQFVERFATSPRRFITDTYFENY